MDGNEDKTDNLLPPLDLDKDRADSGGAYFDIKPSALMMSPNAELRKSFFGRAFSPLGKGSLRGSIFSLSASAIGSGVLSLPYVLKLNGYVLGIMFMVLGSIAAHISLRMLAGLAVDHNLPNFSQICIKAGGEKLNVLLSVMILVFMFGSCISY